VGKGYAPAGRGAPPKANPPEEDYEIRDLTITRGRAFGNQETPQFQLGTTIMIRGSKSGMSKIRVIE
jgi:hypothetical protein